MSTRQGTCFSRAAISMNLSPAIASSRLMPRVARRVLLLLSSVYLRVVTHMRVATAFHTAREQWHTSTVMGGAAQVLKGRRSVAGGVSPRTTKSPDGKAPEGRQTAASMRWTSLINSADLRSHVWTSPVLLSLWVFCRPFGAWLSGRSRSRGCAPGYQPRLLRSRNMRSPPGCHWPLARRCPAPTQFKRSGFET